MVEIEVILNKLARLLKMAGLNLLDENFKHSCVTLFAGLCVVFGHLGSWYFVYAVWPNTELILKSLSIYGLFCQLLVKYLTLITGHVKLQKLSRKVLALHQSYVNGSLERMQPQLWCRKLGNFIFNFIFSLFVVSSIIFFVPSLLIYYFSNLLILPFCFVLPFLDFTTLVGYCINYIIQGSFLFFAIIIESCFDIFMLIFIMHTLAFVDHFKMDLDEFSEFLTQKNSKDPKEVRKVLKKIHKSHLEIIE